MNFMILRVFVKGKKKEKTVRKIHQHSPCASPPPPLPKKKSPGGGKEKNMVGGEERKQEMILYIFSMIRRKEERGKEKKMSSLFGVWVEKGKLGIDSYLTVTYPITIL